MKFLLAFLLLAQPALAQDPENPFTNLPPNDEESFSPFDDGDFQEFGDEAEFAPPGGTAPPRSAGGTSGSAPSASPSPPRGNSFPSGPANRPSGMGVPTNGRTKSPTPGVPRLEPANAKDMVENFDYPDAEILDVTKAIAKLTGKNFIYNPQDIKGRISVVSQTPITVGDAWNAYLTALNMKNFALVPSGKYLRIERVANAKEKQTPIYTDGKKSPNNDEFITRVIPLRYIDATEFETAFRLWIPREARMQAYAQTNTLIITDTASHINRIVELVNLLDVAGYQESLVVMQVKNSVAKDIARLIEQILNDSRTGSAGNTFGQPRPQPAFGASARSTRGRAGGSTISKIIADDRTNSLIVKANAAGILEIRALVRRLDQKTPVADGSGKIHVIQLQFTDAETLAKTLQSITTGSGPNRNQPRTFPVFGEQQNAAVFQSDIKISADKTTQSLVVIASPQDWASLKKVIETLDVPRDQVFIEALLLEMTVNRDDAYGTSFVSASSGIGLPSASNSLQSLLTGVPLMSGFVLGFKKGGQKADVKVGDQTYKVNSLNGLLELIQGNTDANVVATPQIIALDNEDATIEISEETKLPSVTTTNQGVAESFTTDTAQLILKVKPQINKASNFVKLDIDQKLENFDPTNVPFQLQGKVLGKNKRSTITKVIVQDEDTVVISGLMRDSYQEITKKVPILGDIPLLGWLFKNNKVTKKKTNLLVFITPKIIKQYDSIRKVLTNKLAEREEFVRENVGSKDPAGRKVEKLRATLPDLTVIEPLPRGKPIETSSFATPSVPDRDEEDYYDPNSFYYPPEPSNLPPIEGSGVDIGTPGGDSSAPPPITPPEF